MRKITSLKTHFFIKMKQIKEDARMQSECEVDKG